MTPSNELGRFVRSCRGNLRFTCQMVEELSLSKPYFERISPANLVDIEYGRHVPSFGKILTLSEIFDVPLRHFEERYRMDREGAEAVPGHATAENLASEAREELAKGCYRKALLRFKQARELAARHGSQEQNELSIQIANCRRRLGITRVAREELEQILAGDDLTDRQRVRASAYLAEIFSHANNPFMARLLLREAIALARKREMHDLLAKLHNYLGTVYFLNLEYRNALRAYRRALDEHRTRQDRLSFAITLGNIANCHTQLDKFTDAEQLNRESLRIAEELSFQKAIAVAHGNLAELFYRTDRIKEARTHAIQCLAIARVEEYHDVICQAAYVLWEVARRSGDRIQERLYLNTLRRHTARLEFRIAGLKAFYETIESPRPKGLVQKGGE